MEWHKDETVTALARRGDWPALIRHFIARNCYDPALDAAVHVLSEQLGTEQSLDLVQAKVLRLLRMWNEPAIHSTLEEILPQLERKDEIVALQMLGAFSDAFAVEQLALQPIQAGTEKQVLVLISRIDEVLSIVESECEPAVSAILNKARFIGLDRIGHLESALGAGEKAVSLFREIAKSDPDPFNVILGWLLSHYSLLLSSQGKLEASIQPLQEAVGIFHQLADADPVTNNPLLAGCLSDLSMRLAEIGQLEEALPPAQEAVDRYRTLSAGEDASIKAELARCLCNLSIRLRSLEHEDEALRVGRESVALYRALSELDPVAYASACAWSCGNLAVTLCAVDRLQDAVHEVTEAIRVSRIAAESDPNVAVPELAGYLGSESVYLAELGRWEKAVESAREAVTLLRKHSGQNSLRHYLPLANHLAHLSERLGSIRCQDQAIKREALAFGKESVDLFVALSVSDPESVRLNLARAYITVSLCLRNMGRFAEALLSVDKAIEHLRVAALRGAGSVEADLAQAQVHRSAYLLFLGNIYDARMTATDSIDIFQRLPTSIQTVLGQHRASAHRILGLTYSSPKCSSDSNLRKAVDSFREAVHWIEVYRGALRDPRRRRRVIGENVQMFYELLADAAIELWEKSDDVGAFQEALLAAEGSRQRQVLDQLRSEVVLPDAPDAVSQDWRLWFERLEAAELDIEQFELSNINGHRFDISRSIAVQASDCFGATMDFRRFEWSRVAIRAKLVENREAIEERHRLSLLEVRRFHADFDPYQPLPIAGLDDARELLECVPGAVFIEYVISQASGYALLVHARGIHSVRLPCLNTCEVRRCAMRWREGCPNPSDSDLIRQEALECWGAGLELKLLELAPKVLWPVLRALSEFQERCGFVAKSLILCPHMYLNMLPFHAMPLDEGGCELLADRYAISYTPSLSILAQCARRKPDARRPFLIGNPAEDLLFMGVATEAYRVMNPAAEVIHGMDASVDTFLDKAGEMGRVAIWAHMQASSDPMGSSIGFGAGTVLSLSQIYRLLRLRSRPDVELNGCASGLMSPVRDPGNGSPANEDGDSGLTDFDGLPMGFLFAGARSVVSTLWTVYDLSAALLMHRYHIEHAINGLGPVSAMQGAGRWLRREIRNGSELLAAGESLLGRVPVAWASEHPDYIDCCRRLLSREAEEHPHDPPFASPIHWASHYVTGWCWDPVDFDENTRSNYEPGSNSAKFG